MVNNEILDGNRMKFALHGEDLTILVLRLFPTKPQNAESTKRQAKLVWCYSMYTKPKIAEFHLVQLDRQALLLSPNVQYLALIPDEKFNTQLNIELRRLLFSVHSGNVS